MQHFLKFADVDDPPLEATGENRPIIAPSAFPQLLMRGCLVVCSQSFATESVSPRTGHECVERLGGHALMVCVYESVLVAEHSVDHLVRYCAALTKADSQTYVSANDVVRSVFERAVAAAGLDWRAGAVSCPAEPWPHPWRPRHVSEHVSVCRLRVLLSSSRRVAASRHTRG